MKRREREVFEVIKESFQETFKDILTVVPHAIVGTLLIWAAIEGMSEVARIVDYDRSWREKIVIEVTPDEAEGYWLEPKLPLGYMLSIAGPDGELIDLSDRPFIAAYGNYPPDTLREVKIEPGGEISDPSLWKYDPRIGYVRVGKCEVNDVELDSIELNCGESQE